MHQNIAGFLSKRELLEVSLHELSIKHKQPMDVICLSETFVQNSQQSNIQLKNYSMGSVFCRMGQKRGGVCILGHNSIKIKELPFIRELSSEFTFECCGVEILNYKIILICIYRIPGASTQTFFDKLTILLNKLKRKTNKSIILTGDWNIDTLKESTISRDLNELLEGYNLKLHINTPTRRKSCIDHFASNMENARGSIEPLSLSDHETAQILTAPIDDRVEKSQHYFKIVRDFNAENIDKFKQCILNYTWSDIYNSSNMDEAFNRFHTELCLLYNLCFPKLILKINNARTKPNWLTKGIRTSCDTKRKLRIYYYKNKSDRTRTKYRNFSTILRKCIKAAQRTRNYDYVTNAKNKCKATWDIINDTKNRLKLNTIDYLTCNDKIIDDPEQIASHFNQHFTDIPKIDPDPNCDNYSANIKHNNATFFLSPTDDIEIENVIKSLNNTGATGYDELSTKVLKACVNELTPLLTHLFLQPVHFHLYLNYPLLDLCSKRETGITSETTDPLL